MELLPAVRDDEERKIRFSSGEIRFVFSTVENLLAEYFTVGKTAARNVAPYACMVHHNDC